MSLSAMPPSAMSSSSMSPSSLSPSNPLSPGAFLETIVIFLLPYFMDAATALDDARAEVLDTLAAYAIRTRADALQAARIIAFSMATLDTLHQAKTLKMSDSMRIRYRSCANGLNRTASQMQKSLDGNRATDAREPETVTDTPISAASHPPATLAERNKHVWAGAMMDTLKQMGLPVQIIPPAEAQPLRP
jgi:hypothetical protein